MSVLTTFRKIAPEFAATVDATVDDLTDVVSVGLDASVFLARMDEACARLVAHELTLQARAAGSGGVGPVTSASAGGQSESYASILRGDHDDALRATTHGMAFLLIRNSRSDVSFGLLT